MRASLVSALPLALLLSGCLCGAYEGDGDVMYRRGSDSLMLCGNGGFSAVLGTGFVEGRFHQDADIAGANGDTGARVFTLTQTAGTWSSAELGDGWQVAALDKTELDHAHVQCTDLEMRAWWPTTNLPAPTGFAKPLAQFGTVDRCIAAQQRGEYPTYAPCEDELLLCPDGSAQLVQANVRTSGSYATDIGHITVEAQTYAAIDGIFANGQLLAASGSVWTHREVALLTTGLTCR